MASASPPSRTWMHARNASGTYRTMTPSAPSPLSTSYPATSYPGRTASPYYASQYQSLSNGHGHPSTGSSYPTSASPHPQWSSYYARPNPQRSATMTPGPYAATGGKPRPIPIPSRNFSATPAPAPVRRVSVSAVPRPASTRPNVETPKPIPPSDWTNPFKDLVYYRQLLAGNRKCCVCSRTLAVNPTITMNADPTRLTHISCPDCRIIQCRGCSTQRPDCTPHCSQQTKCSALDCCPEVRAIVIFEALSEFDKGLCARSAALSQTETWPIPAEERETFIELALSHSDRKVSDGFGKLMLNTLCIIYDCLVPRSPNISSYDIHDSIRSLLASSFLFEAIHSFLAHRLYDNWVVYGKAYGTLMALIRELGNRRSLRDLVAKTLPRIDESSGVQVCVLYHQEPGTIWVSSTLYPITLLDAALEKRSLKEIINLETMLSEKGEKKMAETAAIIRQFFHELTVVKLLGPTSS